MSNKVIIVTGASDGVGRTIAEQLGTEDVTLILVARRKAILNELARAITTNGGKAIAIPTDLTKTDQIKALVKTTMAQFGRIDVLINVAGMGYYDWIEEQTIDEITKQYMTNVVGMLDIIRQVVPIMKKQHAGHIINFASYASQLSAPPLTVYASTKYAVEGLTDGLRRELSPWNIQVSRVHPTAINTSFNQKAKRHNGINYPFDKLTGVTKEDVARAVINCIRRPRSAVYVAKWRFFVDLVVAINRYAAWTIDLIFKSRTKTMWEQDKRHDPQVDLF